MILPLNLSLIYILIDKIITDYINNLSKSLFNKIESDFLDVKFGGKIIIMKKDQFKILNYVIQNIP